MKPEHEAFGTSIGGTRWFNQEPEVTQTPVRVVKLRWMCPIEGCTGEMVFNGMVWPTGNPGYHHTCDECEFTAAVHRKFPAIAYIEGAAP